MALKQIITRIVINSNLRNVLSRQMSNESPVKSKVVLITGGASGIGYAMTQTLLKCGAKAVMVGDVNENEEALCELMDKYGKDKVFFLKTDVSKRNQFENLFNCAKEKFKQIDLVINNAGIMKDKYWEKCIDINAKGLVMGTLLGMSHMGKHKKGKGGTIINMASVYGLRVAHGCPIYSATKHFVVGFTRSIGHEYYAKMTGVKVLALCPGATNTNMIEEAGKFGLEGFGDVGKVLADGLSSEAPHQPASACGNCLMNVLYEGESGDVWVIKDSECFKLKFPEWQTLRVDD